MTGSAGEILGLIAARRERRAVRDLPALAELFRRLGACASVEATDTEDRIWGVWMHHPHRAAAGALQSLSGHRRLAHWAAAGAARRAPLDVPVMENMPALAAPSEGADIVADYASLGLTLGRHPLALLRPQLRKLGLVPSDKMHRLPHGSAGFASH